MLGFITKNNYTECFIKKRTNSYNMNVCKKYAAQILDNPLQVLNENIREIKNIEKQIQINFESLDSLCNEKPLALFSECIEPNCCLSRKNNVMRDTIEDEILNMELPNDLTYSTYMCGYFFQDIVILTKLLNQKKITNLTLNIMNSTRDYTTYIKNNSKNGKSDDIYQKLQSKQSTNVDFVELSQETQRMMRVQSNKFTIVNFEGLGREAQSVTKVQQRNFMILITYRLLKLIEYLESFDIQITLRVYDHIRNYYDQCILDDSFKCDLFVGIDYIESMPHSIFLHSIIPQVNNHVNDGQNSIIFKMYSIMCTKNGGYIISSHTDGIGSENKHSVILNTYQINNFINDTTFIKEQTNIIANNSNLSKYTLSYKLSELKDREIQSIVIDNITYFRDDDKHTIHLDQKMNNISEYLDEVCFVAQKEYDENMELLSNCEENICTTVKNVWKQISEIKENTLKYIRLPPNSLSVDIDDNDNDKYIWFV